MTSLLRLAAHKLKQRKLIKTVPNFLKDLRSYACSNTYLLPLDAMLVSLDGLKDTGEKHHEPYVNIIILAEGSNNRNVLILDFTLTFDLFYNSLNVQLDVLDGEYHQTQFSGSKEKTNILQPYTEELFYYWYPYKTPSSIEDYHYSYLCDKQHNLFGLHSILNRYMNEAKERYESRYTSTFADEMSSSVKECEINYVPFKKLFNTASILQLEIVYLRYKLDNNLISRLKRKALQRQIAYLQNECISMYGDGTSFSNNSYYINKPKALEILNSYYTKLQRGC